MSGCQAPFEDVTSDGSLDDIQIFAQKGYLICAIQHAAVTGHISESRRGLSPRIIWTLRNLFNTVSFARGIK